MKKIAIIGNAEAFIPRIKHLEFDIQNYCWDDLVNKKINNVDAAMFFPASEEKNAWYKPSLEEAGAILDLAQSGVGIYTECLQTYGWRLRDAIGTQSFLEPRTTWRERAFITNTPGQFDVFCKGDILDCTSATIAIGRSNHLPILTVGNVSCLYNTSDAEGEEAAQDSKHFHVLYKFRDKRHQICANIDIRNSIKKGFLPYQRWNALIDRIILYLTDETSEKAESPEKLWMIPKLADRQTAYQEAVLKNLEWFANVLPQADGSKGVYEGYDTYGHIMDGLRPECQMETALMFHHAGDFFNKPELKKIAENLVDFTLNSGLQITDKNANDYGMWHFYKQFRDVSSAYIDTAARAALGLLHFYELKGQKEYLERAEITLTTLMKLQNENGVLPDCITGGNMKRGGLHTASEEVKVLQGRKHGTPHHHSSVVSSFVKAYLVTNNKKYLDFAAKVQEAMDAGFPDKFEDEFVYKFTIGRYLLGLSALMQTPLRGRFLPSVQKAIKYLLPLRHESGAFVSGVHGDLSGRTFETGIMYSDDDEIADNLYTNNYLGVALQMLDPQEAGFNADICVKLLDFQVSIQNLCKIGNIEGGWTRAFNLRTGDPFAFNGDIGWGPYCMLTGWCNSIISLGCLMYMMKKKIIL
ncbi:MAG: hypothetical protein L3J71_05915 [Victivallaceae bacterium]|nr:hypothetical protein [Victivallaceae bacterium]